jgi:DNA helicase-2/ATP-dependent DNA helicase PcrA
VAQTILEESGYTEMWQKDKSADAAGRLENLKEFVRSMEEFPDMAAFLEHVSLVMEASEQEGADRVSLMTLHAAKGLEFDTVFLPGWEDGLFPNQRALDESGRAGLEEERRLAHVGLTRARKRAKLSFAVNRRIHGLWSSTIPSRFIDELPPGSVDVIDAPAHFSAGASRFDRNPTPFGSSYGTPGWQRAQAATANSGNFGGGNFGGGASRNPANRSGPRQIEGELIAKSTGAPSAFSVGMRVFHTKFGPGDVAAVDGNKLTVDFDKAGQKMVLDSFIQPA